MLTFEILAVSFKKIVFFNGIPLTGGGCKGPCIKDKRAQKNQTAQGEGLEALMAGPLTYIFFCGYHNESRLGKIRQI